jgi:hypothetical protein
MNFQQLLSKMQELDQPVPEAQTNEATIEECGDMPPAPMGMEHKDTPPPSMSVNLNAQGLDDIAELMKLMTKVNPDMINQPSPVSAPSIEIEPMDKPAGLPPLGGLGNLDSGPLKMLPDLDSDDDMSGGEKDMPIKGLDQDNDGDHDMDDHDMEKKGEEPEEKEDEAFGNSAPGDQGSEYKDTDYMVNKLAGGMNKPKQMVKHSYKQGDNPMAMPESKDELRASIRAELLQRLAEAKGAK